MLEKATSAGAIAVDDLAGIDYQAERGTLLETAGRAKSLHTRRAYASALERLEGFAELSGFPLTEQGRVALFERYFPSVPLSLEARTALAKLSLLTPGDFKAVLLRIRLNTLDMIVESLVAELEAESSNKKPAPRIGFLS
jgi:hypothetical protein